jgi:hypothetical protein
VQILTPGVYTATASYTSNLRAAAFEKADGFVMHMVFHFVQVLTSGVYTTTASYTSKIQAIFKLSVGSYASIKAGTARALTVQWPAQVRLAVTACKPHQPCIRRVTLPTSQSNIGHWTLLFHTSPNSSGLLHHLHAGHDVWHAAGQFHAAGLPQ